MSLELIIGPMFSGKSTELIRKIRLAKIINKKVIVIKPIIDIRYKDNKIVSHSFESEECESIEYLKEVDNKINNYDLIVVDEGQFFPDLKEYVLKWVEVNNKDVVVGGLDGGHKRNKIGEILELIPYSDYCIKITSLCKKCNDGTSAIFTFRTNDNQEQVQIGGSESYMPLCRKHYLENIN